MNVRSTIVLAVLAIIGVVAAVRVERGGAATSAAGVIQSRSLLSDRAWSANDVDRITLERDGDRWTFVNREGRWWQTEPVAHAMLTREIVALMRVATELTVVDTIDTTDASLALTAGTLGLDPPAGTLTIAWPGGAERLHFGRRGIAGRSYLRRNEDATVYVVNHELHVRCLEDDPMTWRDPALFAGTNVESDRIELGSGEQAVIVVRDRRTWGMQQPVRTRVNGPALEALIRVLARARSQAFIVDRPDDLKPFGLSTPAGSITVTITEVTQDESGAVQRTPVTKRLLIGARIGVASQDRFGMMDGPEDAQVVVRLAEDLLAAVFLRPEQLVAATASGVVAADIKTIRITGPDGEFRIQRALPKWIAPDHGGRVVEDERVNTLIEILTNVRAAAVELNRFPRELSVATITMFGFDARPIDTVRVARDPETGRWIMENGDGVLRLMAASTKLELRPADYGLSLSR